MKIYGILDPMPFGQFKGFLIGTIIEEQPDYIDWALENTELLLDTQALRYLEEQKV